MTFDKWFNSQDTLNERFSITNEKSFTKRVKNRTFSCKRQARSHFLCLN